MSRNVTLCCDKCGGTREFRPGTPIDPVKLQVSRGDPPRVKPEREYDLCESCLGLFIIWVSQVP